LEEFLKG